MNPVLVLTHNALELTKKAVTSVLAQDIPVHVLAIDNDSNDGTPGMLAALEVQTYRCSPSIGVSRGWNYGLRYFFEMGEDHVFVINNDIELRPDAYRELLADGGPFVTGVGVDTLEESQKPFVKAVRPHPDFSCFLIRHEVWDRVGPFDDSMVLYASDADYHLRMHALGIPAYTIGMPFYHIASGTLKYASPEASRAIREQADKDREVFERKWGCKIGTPEYYSKFKE